MRPTSKKPIKHKGNWHKNRVARTYKKRISRKGMTIYVGDDNLEGALRAFTKMVSDEGILRELESRRYYRKPSDKKREARKMAIKRSRQKEQMLEMDI